MQNPQMRKVILATQYFRDERQAERLFGEREEIELLLFCHDSDADRGLNYVKSSRLSGQGGVWETRPDTWPSDASP